MTSFSRSTFVSHAVDENAENDKNHMHCGQKLKFSSKPPPQLEQNTELDLPINHGFNDLKLLFCHQLGNHF